MVSSAEIAIEGESRRNLAWPKTKSPSGVGVSLSRLDFSHRRAIVRSVHPIDRKPIGMTGVLLPCEIVCNKHSVGDGRHHRRTAIPLDDFRVHRLTRVSNVHAKRIDRGSEFPGVAGTLSSRPPSRGVANIRLGFSLFRPSSLRAWVYLVGSFLPDLLSIPMGCVCKTGCICAGSGGQGCTVAKPVPFEARAWHGFTALAVRGRDVDGPAGAIGGYQRRSTRARPPGDLRGRGEGPVRGRGAPGGPRRHR